MSRSMELASIEQTREWAGRKTIPSPTSIIKRILNFGKISDTRIVSFDNLKKPRNIKLFPSEAIAIKAVDKKIIKLISRENSEVDDIIVGMAMFVQRYLVRINSRKGYDPRIIGEKDVKSITSFLKARIEESDSQQVFLRTPELEEGIELAVRTYVKALI